MAGWMAATSEFIYDRQALERARSFANVLHIKTGTIAFHMMGGIAGFDPAANTDMP